LEVVELIGQHCPWTVSIVLTAYPSIETTSAALRAGACALFEKPKSADQIVSTALITGTPGGSLNLQILEARAIGLALIRARGNRTRAADLLGMSRSWLNGRLGRIRDRMMPGGGQG